MDEALQIQTDGERDREETRRRERYKREKGKTNTDVNATKIHKRNRQAHTRATTGSHMHSH